MIIDYPRCGEWVCTDYEDWDAVGPNDEKYSAVKREYKIVHYHQPRENWLKRLQDERAKRNNGLPLWSKQ